MNELTQNQSYSIQLDLKEASHYRVLQALRGNELSGAQLARQTGYRPSTMVYILRALHKKNLIQISGSGPSTELGGKRPTLWQLNAEYGYVIGVEVTAYQVRLIVMNFAGSTIDQTSIDWDPKKQTDLWEGLLVESIRNATGKHEGRYNRCLGVGVAITGITNREAGVVHYSRQLHVSGFPLKEKLELQLGLPVQIINDANAGALAMKWFPDSDEPYPTIVYFNINETSPEYGAGLILQNGLYEGRSGSAGELTTPLVSREILIEKAREAGYDISLEHPVFRQSDYLSFSSMNQCVGEGDSAAQFIVNAFFQCLAEEVVRIIGLIDPDCIVFGGDLPNLSIPLESSLIPQVESIVKTRFEYGIELPHMQYSPLGSYTGAVGGASIVFRELFHLNHQREPLL